MMVFILVKLQAYSAQSTILAETDFSIDSFQNIFRKLAVSKGIFQKKSLWCPSILMKLWLACSFIINEAHNRLF